MLFPFSKKEKPLLGLFTAGHRSESWSLLRRQACAGDNMKQGERTKLGGVEVVEEKEGGKKV